MNRRPGLLGFFKNKDAEAEQKAPISLNTPVQFAVYHWSESLRGTKQQHDGAYGVEVTRDLAMYLDGEPAALLNTDSYVCYVANVTVKYRREFLKLQVDKDEGPQETQEEVQGNAAAKSLELAKEEETDIESEEMYSK